MDRESYTFPYGKNPFVDSELNITFHKINQMNSPEFRRYILEVKKELKSIW